MSTPMASYDWVCDTNGALTAAEKKVVRAGIRRGYADIARGVATWPMNRGRRVPFALPAPPDSALAKIAVEVAADQGPALLGHGYRTWVLGAALATYDEANIDPELLFVTSLLHDSGMIQQVTGEDFTRRSAQNLIATFERAVAPAEDGRTAADAVVSHITPGLERSTNPLGFYVQAGAMADLAGLRMWDLPAHALREAYRAYPSHDIHRAIPALIRREASDVPDGRFALLKRSGLDKIVTLSPTRWHAR